MENALNIFVDIDDALQTFNHQDLYMAGVTLFKSLRFPVEVIKETLKTTNVDAWKFINEFTPNRIHLTNNEVNYLQHVQGISYLFNLSNECKGLDAIRSCKIKGKRISSLVFLAVELNGFLNERSYYVHFLTQILSKCYTSPVVLLWKFDNDIAISALDNYHDGPMSENVFLSDWHSCARTDIAVIQKLSELRFDNLNARNILDLFYDILWASSRDYYIYPESQEYLKFGLLLNRYISYDKSKYGTPIYLLDDRLEEEVSQRRSYYPDLYGDDYIVEYQQLEIKIDEDIDDISIDELLIMEQYYDDVSDEEDIEDNFYDDEEHQNEEVDEIDEVFFDDPIKLLELLNQK
ncbi:hypothetical protein SD71_01055 [Cohnella kolymensis]|uniref:Uncharacterized protein n=1 Tax=Cohnella kolymensis TaxID=1590652 RepID=A0ABR5A8H0_9BACL|nr:hypothetical protein [Cohnella kolymensis]KIL37314.1 hypothetical protein SD71_01055 [Cohnella kolymensis]